MAAILTFLLFQNAHINQMFTTELNTAKAMPRGEAMSKTANVYEFISDAVSFRSKMIHRSSVPLQKRSLNKNIELDWPDSVILYTSIEFRTRSSNSDMNRDFIALKGKINRIQKKHSWFIGT